MPIEILAESDLPPDVQLKRQKERQRIAAIKQDPTKLSLPERVTRLETILGVGR